jgi:hypothetical protein
MNYTELEVDEDEVQIDEVDEDGFEDGLEDELESNPRLVLAEINQSGNWFSGMGRIIEKFLEVVEKDPNLESFNCC